MQIKEVMSSPAVTVQRETTIHDAIGQMLEHKVGCVVVVVDGNAVGILTRSDALRGAYHAGGDLEGIPVERAMSSDLLTTKRSRTVRKALQTMRTNNIKKLPVVEDFEPIGIVTMTDIARAMPEQVREARADIKRQDDWQS
jgi:CBS domain-containing protein